VDPNEVTPQRIELLAYVMRQIIALKCEDAIKNGATDVRRDPDGGYTLSIPWPPDGRRRRRAETETETQTQTSSTAREQDAPKTVSGETPIRIDRHGAKRGRSSPPKQAQNRPKTSE